MHDSVATAAQETLARKALNKLVQRTFYVFGIGFFAALVAESSYPLLDERATTALFAVLFLSPFAVYIALAVRGRLAANIARARHGMSVCGAALIGLAAFLGLNGSLDRAPAELVRTSIVNKRVIQPSRGGSSVTHVLDLASWRRGHDEEHIRVGRAQYRRSQIGEEVVIEVHAGRFGVPWHGSITP